MFAFLFLFSFPGYVWFQRLALVFLVTGKAVSIVELRMSDVWIALEPKAEHILQLRRGRGRGGRGGRVSVLR